MKDKKVLVFMPEDKLAPKGGPAAVCYYYNEEKKKRGDRYFEFLPAEGDRHPIVHTVENILIGIFPFIKKRYKTMREINHHRLILDVEPSANTPVDLNQYDIIHFHDTVSLYRMRNALKFYNGTIVIQSHSPIPRGLEICKDMPVEIKNGIKNIEEKYEKLDRYAFDRADYFIFPCPYAEEPYYDNWEYFRSLHSAKPKAFKYVLTGIPQALPKRTRTQILKEQNIPESEFVITYVGRHNTVKGYDILKDIIAKYFGFEERAWVISAGKQTPFTRLVHPRWKEVGFTNDAHSYIAAADVFVLPNRVTYFDIVMLEVLSLGKIVIASRTGGNRYFEKEGVKGVLLYDTVDEAVELLKKVKSMSREEKKELEISNARYFKENLNVESMYDNYIKVLKEILDSK